MCLILEETVSVFDAKLQLWIFVSSNGKIKLIVTFFTSTFFSVSVDERFQINQINLMNSIYQLSQMNPTNQMNQVSQMNLINQMNHMKEMNQRNQVNQISQMRAMNPTTQILQYWSSVYSNSSVRRCSRCTDPESAEGAQRPPAASSTRAAVLLCRCSAFAAHPDV